jgi:hypothetical protein
VHQKWGARHCWVERLHQHQVEEEGAETDREGAEIGREAAETGHEGAACHLPLMVRHRYQKDAWWDHCSPATAALACHGCQDPFQGLTTLVVHGLIPAVDVGQGPVAEQSRTQAGWGGQTPAEGQSPTPAVEDVQTLAAEQSPTLAEEHCPNLAEEQVRAQMVEDGQTLAEETGQIDSVPLQ